MICENTNSSFLVSIKPKPVLYFMTLLLSISITIFSIFFVVVPVIVNFDIAYIYPLSDKRYFVKLIIFMCSILWLIGLPYMISILNRSKINFCYDRIVVYTIIPKSHYLINYGNAIVTEYDNNRISIRRNMSENIVSSILHAVRFSLRQYNLYEIDKINIAKNLLKEKASNYIIKQPY